MPVGHDVSANIIIHSITCLIMEVLKLLLFEGLMNETLMLELSKLTSSWDYTII